MTSCFSIRTILATAAAALATSLLLCTTGCSSSGSTSSRTSETRDDNASLPRFVANVGYFDDFSLPAVLNNWYDFTGNWRIRNGHLYQRDKGLSREAGQFHHLILKDAADLRNVELRCDVMLPGKKSARQRQQFIKSSHDTYAGVLVRFRDPYNFYLIQLARVTDYADGFYLYKMQHGNRQYRIDEKEILVNPQQWFPIRARAIGSKLQGYLGDELVIDVEDDAIKKGYVGVSCRQGAAAFDDFELRVLD
jgi:hypothetical protein